MSVELFEKIPNNVNLSSDKRLQRALEQWLPNYLSWWQEMGPEGFQGRSGLPAHRDLRRGERLGALRLRAHAGVPLGHLPGAARAGARIIGFWRSLRRSGVAGSAGRVSSAASPHHRHAGRYRAGFRRAAAPPGADRAVALRHAQPVSGQRRRGPSPVGDGLSAAFPTSAKTAAKKPRRCWSGAAATPDKPRILGAFNEPIKSWLDFYMFTMFTDRDGKFQLCALSESGFDPLSRTCKFMLTEEAHPCSSARPASTAWCSARPS